MSEKPTTGPSTDFTRGWELFGHFLSMLKASLARHLLASAFVGVLIGSALFCGQLGSARPQALVRYAAAEIREAPDRVQMRREFDGRPPRFLLQQWFLRVLLVGGLSFAFGSLLIVRHGGSIRKR